jgi:hypothetical protein
MTDQFTTYVVQAWIEGYEYWANTSESVEGMFSMPKLGYDSEDQGRERLAVLQAASPATKYRLIRQVTTSTEN